MIHRGLDLTIHFHPKLKLVWLRKISIHRLRCSREFLIINILVHKIITRIGRLQTMHLKVQALKRRSQEVTNSLRKNEKFLCRLHSRQDLAHTKPPASSAIIWIKKLPYRESQLCQTQTWEALSQVLLTVFTPNLLVKMIPGIIIQSLSSSPYQDHSPIEATDKKIAWA